MILKLQIWLECLIRVKRATLAFVNNIKRVVEAIQRPVLIFERLLSLHSNKIDFLRRKNPSKKVQISSKNFLVCLSNFVAKGFLSPKMNFVPNCTRSYVIAHHYHQNVRRIVLFLMGHTVQTEIKNYQNPSNMFKCCATANGAVFDTVLCRSNAYFEACSMLF